MGGAIEYGLPVDPALSNVKFLYPYVNTSYPNWPEPGPTSGGGGTAGVFALTFSAVDTTISGANYGPDTPGTTTSGAFECMEALATLGGGLALGLQGAYTWQGSTYFPGPDLTLRFEPGSSLTLPDGITPVIPSWASTTTTPSLALNGGIIHMGSDPSNPTIWSHQRFEPNGLAVDCGINDNNAGSVVVYLVDLRFPGSASATPYTGDGGHGWYIGAFDATNRPHGVVQVLHENAGEIGIPFNRFPTGIEIEGFRFTGSATENASSGQSLLFLRGGALGVVRGVVVDCSAFPTVQDYSCFNGTGSMGEVFGWRVESSVFRSNGAKGQVFEVQGNSQPGATEGIHELTVDSCLIDGGAPGSQAGTGGMYLDDNINVPTTNGGWWDDIRFVHCEFNTGVSISAAALNLTVPSAGPFSHTNGTRIPQVHVVSGGTVASISVNGNPTGITSGNVLVLPGETFLATYTSGSPPAVAVEAWGTLVLHGTWTGDTVFASTTFSPNGRFTGQGGAIGIGPSVYNARNRSGRHVQAVIVGGTLSSVSMNGNLPLGNYNGLLDLKTNDYLALTYTSAPVVYLRSIG